jgi:uncharacterized protein (AIM24 family)
MSQLTAGYTCPYCRVDSAGYGATCPHCGAALDVRERISRSGWVEQPAIRDMTRLHFGHSSCQISGTYVPVAEFSLGAGDSLYFSHHGLLHAEPGVELDVMLMPDDWSRSLAGMPVYMMTARGPGHLANVWYRTRYEHETTWHYPLAGRYLDRFEATDTPGLLLLHAPGSTFIRDLADSDTVYVKPEAVVWKDHAVRVSLHTEQLAGGQGYYMWVKLQGPGRVVVKSIFGYAGWSGSIVDSTPRTSHAW